jgi:uncharacterized membrane protein
MKRKHDAVQLLREMKSAFESLPQNKRKELIAALKEIFSELGPAADGAAAPRSA